MPLYAYACNGEEQHEFESYVPTYETPNPACQTCGSPTERIWKITKRTGYSQYPYTTKNITGQEITITDAAHEARLMKEHNLVKRDDAAWLEEEYLGYNPYTGKQEYSKPSGVGLPGCWV